MRLKTAVIGPTTYKTFRKELLVLILGQPPSVLDVMKNTQQLFNSGERQGRGTHVVRIKCQVGDLNWNQPFHLGLQPDYATTAELSMVSHADQREGSATQRVPGIDDGDGLFG